DIHLIVGTHALFSKGVAFQNLGLVIADEQHRFGVEQRAALAAKGQTPHVLVMSATPIPRTLALMIYGDLDVSVIDELPPGRTP
ncbi:MAG: ATP-dependent DNA helicase RecG, partial [Oscillospiraceae bacterium]